ncbi:cobalamin biosynthesis protein, partial [Clostridium perfringens]
MKCKLEVVSGFLGSGKTSFISSYLTTDICKDENILVILLEKGSKDVIR